MLKKYFTFLVILFFSFCQILTAQNIGIGTETPQQKLDVNGAVKIGNTSTNNPGTIRYNSGKFEGGNGTDWKSFDGLPSKSIILVRSKDTAEFKAAGYEVFKESQIDDTVQIVNSLGTLAGLWQRFTVTSDNPDKIPIFPYSSESVIYNDKIVVYNPLTGNLHAFNPLTSSWEILSTSASGLPAVLFYSLTIVNNQIFVLGGADPNLSFEVSSKGAKYDLLTNTWMPIDLPEASALHATCGFNNELWFFSGVNDVSSGLLILQERAYKYDLSTSTWSVNLAPTPSARVLSGNAQKYGDKIVILSFNKIKFFNPADNSFTDFATIGSGTIGKTNFTIKGDSLYLLGEFQETNTDLSTSNVYKQFKFNLIDGNSQQLNTCIFRNESIPQSLVQIYTYSPADNNFYFFRNDQSDGIDYFKYSESGSEECTNTTVLNTFLYYMRKL